MSRPAGPNVKRLITTKMARDAIPDGGGFADGLNFLSKPGELSRAAREATKWVFAAIEAVRRAEDPNPWRDADDETIAAEILKKIEER